MPTSSDSLVEIILPFKLLSGEDNRERELYINLMLRCLQISESSRPSIDTVISENFFAGIRNKSEYKDLNIRYEQDKFQISRDFYSVIENDMKNYETVITLK